jgi:D-tagatose-1,6-bisphosphate aldolase subunit GatZ/KbaZ
MYLDDILASQKRGEARGIASVCSAHPYVLKQTLRTFERPLIEATCNQVNQFGGYTGMRPADFVRYVRGIAEKNNFPFENIILGGDHLGPSIWQAEPAEVAMAKAEMLIHDYVEAGFVKIHLDCSMRLEDDPEGALDVEISARRTARLAGVAETVAAKCHSASRYVIGTEVPIPGGATQHEERVSVTRVEDAQQTIEVTRDAFLKEDLESAWERVIAVVVQPGVEFGDDFVLPYQANAARNLSRFIENQPMIYEAHSTDYQTRQALGDLVRDHFAILKVGPGLTFAFREAVFALAMMEAELLPLQERSNIISVLDEVMLEQLEHWAKYYHGDEKEKAFKRKYSLSDRIRYYWNEPRVQQSFGGLLERLNQSPLPATLLKQYVPDVYATVSETGTPMPEQILLAKIQFVLDDYAQACKCQ